MSSIFRVIGVLVVTVLSVAAFAASPLDETMWRVEITPEGSTVADYIDRIRFEKGNFASAIFERKGFPAVACAVAEKEGASAWTVNQKSAIQGELAWNGEVQGEVLKGTLVWKQADGKVVNYALNGSPVVEEPTPKEAAAAAAAEGEKAVASKKVKKGLFGCSLVR